jgi:hypothetical protein
MRLALLLLVLVASACFPDQAEPPDPGQAPTTLASGVIAGTVVTSSGQPVAGAVVYLPQIDVSATTGPSGMFVLPNLSEGTYDIEAVPPGSRRAQAIDGANPVGGDRVSVRVGDTSRVTLRLPRADDY